MVTGIFEKLRFGTFHQGANYFPISVLSNSGATNGGLMQWNGEVGSF